MLCYSWFGFCSSFSCEVLTIECGQHPNMVLYIYCDSKQLLDAISPTIQHLWYKLYWHIKQKKLIS